VCLKTVRERSRRSYSLVLSVVIAGWRLLVKATTILLSRAVTFQPSRPDWGLTPYRAPRPNAPMKITDTMTNDQMVQAVMDCVAVERARRERVYSAELSKALHLLDSNPMARLTHTRRAHRCVQCERRIHALELHYVFDGLRLCQDTTCSRGRPTRPTLRLACVDGEAV
jgi:hypothetical protein